MNIIAYIRGGCHTQPQMTKKYDTGTLAYKMAALPLKNKQIDNSQKQIIRESKANENAIQE